MSHVNFGVSFGTSSCRVDIQSAKMSAVIQRPIDREF
jgi:hypothetical protein